MNLFKLLGGVFAMVGCLVLCLSLWLGYRTTSMIRSASRTPGEVVEVVTRRDSRGKRLSHPVFRFALPDGALITVASDIRSYPPSHRVGERVMVLYHPQDPQSAIIDDFSSKWFGTLIAGILGVPFTLMGLFMLRVAFHKERSAKNLRQRGTRIRAEVTSIVRDEARYDEEDGTYPYCIHAQWFDPEAQVVRQFESEPFHCQPESYDPVQQSPRCVDVWMLPGQPDRYEMDITFVPEPPEAPAKVHP